MITDAQAAPAADPRRLGIRRWLPALLIGVGGGAWYAIAPAASPLSTRSGMAERAEYPVIRVAVNEHLRQIAARSTFHFDFSEAIDNSSTSVEEPAIVEYAGPPGASFRLPPAGFVSLAQSGGWVYDITVALPGGSEALDNAYATAVMVDGILANTKWQRAGEPVPSLDQIRHDLVDSTAGLGGNRGFGQWRLGTTELNVTLKRTAQRGDRTLTPGRRVAADLYAVEVEIYDGSRKRAYDLRLFSMREARQHGDALRALPLEAVLDDRTPVPSVGSSGAP